MADGTLPGGWAADDGAGILFTDGQVSKFISEEPGKRVYRVEASDLPSTSGLAVDPVKDIEQL